jgi:hypothetical protein
MERDMDRGKRKETMDPIMMDEEYIKEIMDKARTMRNGRPYQYKINSKRRAIVERECLDNDVEEVEDLCATRKIEEILRTTYDRKTRGQGSSVEEGSPFQIIISMEPIGTWADPGFNTTTTHQKIPNYQPFWQHLRSK